MRSLQKVTICLVGLLTGCAAISDDPVNLRLQEPRVTCAQALRASRDALRKLGYTVEAVDQERDGKPGRVVAVRHAGWSPADPQAGESHKAVAVVRCDDSGATVEVEAEGEAMERIRFPAKFGEEFRAALVRGRSSARTAPPPGRVGARQVAERGVLVTVAPLGADEAPPVADADPLGAGILPVRVEVANRTDRRYAFAPADIRLTTVEGERRAPLSGAELGRRFGAATASAAALVEAGIAAGEIGPGEVRRGFVYFDAATYQRATVVVTDVESGEAEGFSVRF